jgi:hypothetical protein
MTKMSHPRCVAAFSLLQLINPLMTDPLFVVFTIRSDVVVQYHRPFTFRRKVILVCRSLPLTLILFVDQMIFTGNHICHLAHFQQCFWKFLMPVFEMITPNNRLSFLGTFKRVLSVTLLLTSRFIINQSNNEIAFPIAPLILDNISPL